MIPAGGTRVSLHAEADGVEVIGTDVEVLLGPTLAPVAVSFGPNIARMSSRRGAAPLLTAADATVTVLRGMTGRSFAPTALREHTGRLGWLELHPVRGAELGQIPPRARRVLVPSADGTLAEAWQLEVFVDDATAPQAQRALVDARTGIVLQSSSLRSDATYQAWAEPDLTPQDGPYADLSPHPTGTPDGHTLDVDAPSVLTVDGLNQNPDGGSDPWIPDGTTTLRGNSAWAYVDRASPAGFGAGDSEIDASSAEVYAWDYDFTADAGASAEQADASGTHAFYVVNWLADAYYDAGFDEQAGNAQVSNYGRGGAEGDPVELRIQSQYDARVRNQAYTITPSDGFSPMIHFFPWTPMGQVISPDDTYVAASAVFGPSDTTVTAPLAWAQGNGDHLACDTLDTDLAGAIALVDDGGCDDDVKAKNVEDAGAVGMIEIDASGMTDPRALTGATWVTQITIPAMAVLQDDGDALAAALELGSPDVTLVRPPDSDGALDTSLIAHEWSHYVFGRLVSCTSAVCGGINEGWSDATGLHVMLREGDDLSGAYAVGAWSAAAITNDPAYFGVRRQPYSTDPAIDGLSYRHVLADEPLPDTPYCSSLHPDGNTEVHNTGEVWASAEFGAYVALQAHATESFDTVHRRWIDILVGALGLMPDDPSFLDARDALIATAAVSSPDEAAWIAQAFADRGMGTCAVAPDSTGAGLVESFVVVPLPSIGTPTLDDTTDSCDDDGVLDGGETGRLTVPVYNLGVGTLDGAVLTVVSDDPSLTFPEGDSIPVPTLGPLASGEVSIPVALDGQVSDLLTPTVTFTLADDALCTGDLVATGLVLANADITDTGSPIDTFLAPGSVWTADETGAPGTWAVDTVDWGDAAWVAVTPDYVSDTRLVSPPMTVAEGGDLRISLTHVFHFETLVGQYRDGGTIELRVDGGEWQDVSTWVDPGYPGLIDAEGNPLDGLPGFGADNSSYPNPDIVLLDLGSSLGGHVVELAFRVATNGSVGGGFWAIDEVSVEGLASGPFPGVGPDPDACADTDTGTDTGTPDSDTPVAQEKGCGCATGPSPALPPAFLAVLIALAARRRR